MVALTPERRALLDYNRQADTYARHRGVHPGVVRALIERGDIGPRTRILDVGCGTGNYAQALRALTGCRMSGVEASIEMIERARNAATWETLAQARAEHLPFSDGAFDLVMSTDVIHHLSDRSSFFREAFRVLCPGGQIATVTDSHDDLARRRPLTSHFPETLAIERERYPAVPRLLAEMAAAGFVPQDLSSVTLEYELTDIRPYRERAFSSLLLIDDEAFQRRIAHLEAELTSGPIIGLSLYTIVWGSVPPAI
jgi:ubiquinone/menaquinone biosynthesis C-methylase UbiE